MTPEIKQIDRAANPPTTEGAHGAAWRLDLPSVRAAMSKAPDSDATVALWVVFAPWAHGFWSYYAVGAVHLRPLPDVPPPKIILAGATHEVMVYALDPREVPDLRSPARQLLQPSNFHGQWRAAVRPNPVDLDRAAAEKIDGVVAEILAGMLNPDTDALAQWVERFSDSNLRK